VGGWHRDSITILFIYFIVVLPVPQRAARACAIVQAYCTYKQCLLSMQWQARVILTTAPILQFRIHCIKGGQHLSYTKEHSLYRTESLL
jgi:hypothetical protein